MVVLLFSIMGCSALLFFSYLVLEKERRRSKKRRQIHRWIKEVMNHFQYEADIVSAIECALSYVPEAFLGYGRNFLDTIIESVALTGGGFGIDAECDSGGEKIEDFLETEPEWYEKLFLFMCAMMESMDIPKHLFHNEMMRLCLILEQEERAEQKMHNSMSGTVFVGIVPCAMLPLFRLFAIQNLPKLRGMYDGVYGILCLLLIGFSLLFSCGVLESIRRKLWEGCKEKEWELICWESVFLRETYRADAELMLDWFILFSKEIRTELMDIRSCCEQFGYEDFIEEIWSDDKPDWEKQLLYAIRSSDRIGIKQAFQNKEQELESGQKKEMQRKEQVLKMAQSIAPAVSFLPFYVTVGFYLVVPFVTESMKQLSGILSAMEQIW